MTIHYLYHTNYQVHEEELCFLEMKSLFHKRIESKNFYSKYKQDPSISPFIRCRIELIKSDTSLDDLLKWIEAAKMHADDYLVKYIDYNKNKSSKEKKDICRSVGFLIGGQVAFKNPQTLYGVTYYKGKWVFGYLSENTMAWQAHKKKPHAYSSALNIRLAKVLVNLAGNGDFTRRLIDPCCGIATVVLEGKYSGYHIKGYDINENVCKQGNENLVHFGYEASLQAMPITEVKGEFDASIVDLPYGILSKTDKANQLTIIKEAKRLSKKIILVAKEDMTLDLKKLNIAILESCQIRKAKQHYFIRYIYICK